MKKSKHSAITKGTLVAGRYRVDRRRAKGGMATVYAATDTTLNRTVALKVLAAGAEDKPGRMAERFRQEAEALAKLSHRHIVSIFDFGEMPEGGYYLVMEFVDGPTLGRLLSKESVDLRRGLRIITQVAKALRYSHDNGIVHRDVKAGNVLMATEDDEEYAKLVDFGLVKLNEGGNQLTAHGLILGTVTCMAPEQILGLPVDARTDIYALGVVLFRVITGSNPFESEQTPEVLSAHLHSRVPSFAEIDPELKVPPGLEQIVRRAMQKNQANRYETIDEMIEELEHCRSIRQEHYVSVQESASNRAIGGLSRGLMVSLLVALTVLVVLLAAIVALLLYAEYQAPPAVLLPLPMLMTG